MIEGENVGMEHSDYRQRTDRQTDIQTDRKRDAVRNWAVRGVAPYVVSETARKMTVCFELVIYSHSN